LKTVEERLKSYEPLWENWTYSGEFLGEGAMSSVFEIQSTAMGFKEVAALKIVTVKKNLRGEVRIPETALNEIKILRDLSGCPNIVNYHDSTQRQIYDDNNHLSEIDILIKMEKLQPLSEGDNLSEAQVIKLGKDMCTALIHASDHNIIHRDIKPQNIFVDKEGTYKLGDFGIAKIVSEYTSGFTMNIGTLAYTAPEIHRNSVGKYDISSDVYSLGLVMYIFLNNGCLPFTSTSATLNEAISKRLSGAPFPSPARGNKSLRNIIMRACAGDVSKRYKTPQEMLEDLELLSTGGKKMVVDPFATLDANIDATDDLYGSASASGGLRINISSEASSSTSSSASSSGSGSRLRMSFSTKDKETIVSSPSSAVSSPPSATPPVAVSSPPSSAPSTSTTSTGSRLIINMGTKRKSASEIGGHTEVVSPKPETSSSDYRKDEGKSSEESSSTSFFNTPGSI